LLRLPAFFASPWLSHFPLIAERFDRVSVNYVPPKDPAYHAIYQQLKEVRALERVQELLSPFRLPHRLLLKVTGCDGVSNAWYEENEITVCYEFLNDILKNAPEQTLPVGITRHDAILGPAIDVFLHESRSSSSTGDSIA
jgi:hypothetical protein